MASIVVCDGHRHDDKTIYVYTLVYTKVYTVSKTLSARS